MIYWLRKLRPGTSLGRRSNEHGRKSAISCFLHRNIQGGLHKTSVQKCTGEQVVMWYSLSPVHFKKIKITRRVKASEQVNTFIFVYKWLVFILSIKQLSNKLQVNAVHPVHLFTVYSIEGVLILGRSRLRSTMPPVLIRFTSMPSLLNTLPIADASIFRSSGKFSLNSVVV